MDLRIHIAVYELLELCCLCLSLDRTRHKINDPNVGLKRGLGEAKVRHEQRLEPCWSSTHLVQCGPDGPSRTWTQIWAQAHMPDYSLN